MIYQRRPSAHPHTVLMASSGELLASSLRAVLEPQGFLFEHVPTSSALLRAIESSTPDVIILDEDLADASLASLGGGGDSGLGCGIPLLLYSAGHWKPTPREHRVDVGAWDVIEEPVRSQDLLACLDRLLQLKGMWNDSSEIGSETDAHHLSWLLRVAPLLDSIASRAESTLGCVVLGPTRPAAGMGELEAERAETISLVLPQVRGSDICVWVGPSELAVILYGAGIDGLGQFVTRVARGRGSDREDRPLSAGVVAIEPRDGERGATDSRGGPESLWILGQVDAARLALGRAREAGGGIRVAASA